MAVSVTLNVHPDFCFKQSDCSFFFFFFQKQISRPHLPLPSISPSLKAIEELCHRILGLVELCDLWQLPFILCTLFKKNY